MTGNRSTRRAFLRAGGAALAAVGLAGCGGWPPDEPPAETTTPPTETAPGTTTETTDGATDGATDDGTTTTRSVDEERFGTVVNVADAGADASGEDPVNPVLADHLDDDTLLKFPEGRYRLEPWEVVDYRNLGIVGEDAALVPPSGERGYWLMFGQLRDFAFEGFTLDCRETGVAPVNHISVNGGSSFVRDVSLRGHRRVPKTGFEIAAADPSAEFAFENVELPHGSTGGNAIYVFPKSVGKLTIRDCYVEHWAEGLYAAYHSGPLRVLGGYYANNGIDQVRVGGGHRGALVKDVTVRVDDPKRPEAKPNMRGIWLEEGGRARVENCDIAITDLTGTYSSGAIVVGRQFGSATVENTEIRTDAAAPGILVRDPIEDLQGQFAPSLDRLPDEWSVTCRNVRIFGDAPSGSAVMANRRDDCLLEDVCINHPRGSRDGIEVSHADGFTVRDSTISVGGDAITTEAATVVTNGLREDGRC